MGGEGAEKGGEKGCRGAPPHCGSGQHRPKYKDNSYEQKFVIDIGVVLLLPDSGWQQ